MRKLNRFESTVPLRVGVKGISQLNSFVLAYWQREINLNPQHILKWDELLLNAVNFQMIVLNFTDIHFHMTSQKYCYTHRTDQWVTAVAKESILSLLFSPVIKWQLKHGNVSSKYRKCFYANTICRNYDLV